MKELSALVHISLRYRFVVAFLALLTLVLGTLQIQRMPIDVFPEFAPPQVEIQTPALGLSAEEVEALITAPMEEAFAGLPGLEIMRSKSVEQLSSIKLIFERGTDLMEARQAIQERMSLVIPTLPTWAAPPNMMPPLSSTARTVKIGIRSDTLSTVDLSMITYWTIRERLLRVPGVANVAIWGERIDIPTMLVDPEKLAEHGVTSTEVMQVMSDTLDSGMVQYSEGSVIGTGGWIDTASARLPVHYVAPVTDADTLGQVPLNDRTDADGNQLRLDDVGTVAHDTWPMIGDAVVNDGEGLLLIVEKFPWANTVEVTRGVEQAMADMAPGLPELIYDTTIFRPATFVEISIENLTRAILIGAALVLLILLLFLYEWRTALISATIIPLSLMSTLLIMPLFGATVSTINVMVLAGLVIAVGAVVDDAIVDVENIVRRLREQRASGIHVPTSKVVIDASVEVRNAIIYASLIEAVALMPVFFLEGLSGAFFQPLARAYVIAVLVSGFIAMTVTPALSYILLRRARSLEHRQSPIIAPLHRGYNAALKPVVGRPMLAIGALVLLATSGLGIYPRLGQELLPDFKERDFLMHWLGKPGTSHPEMVRISQLACQELMTIDGVNNCGSHIGQALLMDEVYGIYFGENWVSVDPSVDYDETLAEIQSLVDGYPGLYRDVQTYLKERIREVLTGSSHPIVVRIYGEDMDVLRAKAAEIEEDLIAVGGLTDVHVEFLVDIPQIDVKVDLDRAREYGVKPGDVRRQAGYLLAGEEAGDIHGVNRTFDVNIWSAPQYRDSLTDIYNLPIETASGDRVALQEIADVSIVPTANAVNRENLARRIHIEAELDGVDLSTAVDRVEDVLDNTEFPVGYYPELLGEFSERQAASRNLFRVSLLAAVLVFVLLYVSYNNVKLAALSFFTLLTALVGGVLAAWLTGGVLSLGSLVGFLTVLGIAARNGIMLINHYQHLQKEEGMDFGVELVLRGARERVAPILMTALTTGLALVPLVISGNLPGHEIEFPMAIVILGGLITSTLVNLFIVPPLYLMLGDQARPDEVTVEAALV
ncbi:MAG: efflux RND transporter permease subunit [Acidimicrobiia bacterium]|nr:efflux RND transporter permease subunit [Acidimicrobiia bacterium]